MVHRLASAIVTLLAAAIPFVGGAMAAEAPRLPIALSTNANDLQRAAWACEAGAPVVAPSATSAKAGPVRYFLSGAGEAGTAEPPLVLSSHQLTGFGWLSDDQGWSVVRFRCALTPDLRRATAFSFAVLALAKAPTGDPITLGPPGDIPSRPKMWSADLKRVSLSYGMPETNDVDFSAQCRPHAGLISLQLSQTVKWLEKDGYVVVSLGDGTHSGLYVARGVLNEEAGASMPRIIVPADDPLFSWIAGGRTLLVNIGRDLAYSVPLAGATQPARAFVTVCR